MAYYNSQRRRGRGIKGRGLLDSLISAVTSQAAKEVATNAAKQVATKAVTDVGNRATKKIIDKVIPPKKGGNLNEKSIAIKNKYLPIQEYVKKY